MGEGGVKQDREHKTYLGSIYVMLLRESWSWNERNVEQDLMVTLRLVSDWTGRE